MISRADANEIVLSNYNNIYSFCCARLDDTNVAHDVTQEVFLFFQESLDKLDNRNIRAWLYSVADKKIKSEYREQMQRSSILNINDEKYSDSEDCLYELEDCYEVGDDVIEAVKSKILKQLTPQERQLFIKIYKEKMKYSDIARELNTSAKTISVRSFRLRKKIRELVEISFMILVFLSIKLKI